MSRVTVCDWPGNGSEVQVPTDWFGSWMFEPSVRSTPFSAVVPEVGGT